MSPANSRGSVVQVQVEELWKLQWVSSSPLSPDLPATQQGLNLPLGQEDSIIALLETFSGFGLPMGEI